MKSFQPKIAAEIKPPADDADRGQEERAPSKLGLARPPLSSPPRLPIHRIKTAMPRLTSTAKSARTGRTSQ